MNFWERLSEPKYVEKVENALLVAKRNAVIAPVIAPVGYDDAGLAIGNALHKKAVTSIRDKHANTTEENDLSRTFQTNHKDLCVIYNMHREIADVAFDDSPKILQELSIDVSFPKSYPLQIETIDNFYTIHS